MKMTKNNGKINKKISTKKIKVLKYFSETSFTVMPVINPKKGFHHPVSCRSTSCPQTREKLSLCSCAPINMKIQSIKSQNSHRNVPRQSFSRSIPHIREPREKQDVFVFREYRRKIYIYAYVRKAYAPSMTRVRKKRGSTEAYSSSRIARALMSPRERTEY